MKEREISLLDLIIDILLHWRSIIVIMLIGGILLGGVGYIRANIALRSYMEKQEIAEREEDIEKHLIENLTETQLANVNAALTYKELYEDMLDYQQQSELMKIDPMSVARTELTFRIASENMERTYNLQSLYRILLTGSGLYEWLENDKGMSASVNELISLDNSTVYANGTILLAQDTLGITIVYSDEEGSQALKESIIEFMQNMQRNLSETVGTHEIVLLNDSFSYVVDTNIMEKQRNCDVSILSYQTSYAKAVGELEEDEKKYYKYQLAMRGELVEEETDSEDIEGSEDVSTAAVPNVITSAIKYLILGMLLAAFLYVFVLFLKYIMNSRLREVDSLSEIYGISQLGMIPQKEKQKKFLSIIDKWILTLRSYEKRIFTTQEALALVISAVKITAQKNTVTKIAVVGCDMKNAALSYIDEMKKQLKKEGIEIQILNNILYDAESMEQLTEVHAAILLEIVGSTLYTEVEQELEMLKRQDIIVLGGILAEQ